MTDEKKPAGPVVIRKGHVKPPPPGTPLEVPVVESLDAAPARTEKPDGRPLWQRLADQKKAELGGAAPAPAWAAPGRAAAAAARSAGALEAGLHAGVRRFVNPHQFPVGLERRLSDLRVELTLAARRSPR